ncbi:vitamin K epoxide reductase family protein [Mucilaginibacter sp.]|uniref:vitamin K epoxide reductase family protein n=1 Tax=Mucilaginibacter sp. TaxID=1882438 RepID=UPI003AFFF070
MISFTKQPNLDETLINLLKHSGISVDAETVTNELNTHPDYPSLLAITDVAANFGLSCVGYRISKEDLLKVPCPFIANMDKDGSEFMFVTGVTTESVSVNNNRKLSFKEFAADFTGVVLAVDPKNSGTKTTTTDSLFKTISSYRYLLAPFLLVLALLCGLLLHFNNLIAITWPYALLLLFKSAGVITSILLLVQSIDQNNPLIQKLCGGGDKTNCNAILSSKAATVFKGLSWSEVGFFYFTGTWLAILFGGGSTTMLQALALFNIVSLPYTFYSIYYQYKVAKQWCTLCCTVQALLWLEFAALVSFSPGLYNLNTLKFPAFPSLLTLFICLSLPVALWLLLKPLLLEVQQVRPLKSQLRKLKYNKEFFDSLLHAQPKYAIPGEDWSIVLGNAEAENIITMVSNPYCPPCAKTHQILDEWLNTRNDLQVRFVFTANNTEADRKTPVTRHLMALNDKQEKGMVKKALHDWYEQKQKNYEDWAKIYPIQLDEKEYGKLDRQLAWCSLAEIKATPTFLVNGYRLPETYQLKDIKYLLN